MIEFSKSEKQLLRKLAGDAHAVELSKELEKLKASFFSWRKGEIDVFELDEKIHQFHSGPHKQLFNYYQQSGILGAEVARALARNLISGEQLSTGLREKIKPWVEYYERERKD